MGFRGFKILQVINLHERRWQLLLRQSTRISQQTESTQSNSEQNIEEESEANTYIPLPDHIYKKISMVYNAWIGHRGIKATMDMLKNEGVQWRNMKKTCNSIL